MTPEQITKFNELEQRFFGIINEIKKTADNNFNNNRANANAIDIIQTALENVDKAHNEFVNSLSKSNIIPKMDVGGFIKTALLKIAEHTFPNDSYNKTGGEDNIPAIGEFTNSLERYRINDATAASVKNLEIAVKAFDTTMHRNSDVNKLIRTSGQLQRKIIDLIEEITKDYNNDDITGSVTGNLFENIENIFNAMQEAATTGKWKIDGRSILGNIYFESNLYEEMIEFLKIFKDVIKTGKIDWNVLSQSNQYNNLMSTIKDFGYLKDIHEKSTNERKLLIIRNWITESIKKDLYISLKYPNVNEIETKINDIINKYDMPISRENDFMADITVLDDIYRFFDKAKDSLTMTGVGKQFLIKLINDINAHNDRNVDQTLRDIVAAIKSIPTAPAGGFSSLVSLASP